MKGKIVLALILVVVLPALLLRLQPRRSYEGQLPNDAPQEDGQQQDTEIAVRFDDHIQKVLLEDYVVNVVLAEMPALFSSEALKAQAVVARTYTCYRMSRPKHTDAAVCTDHTCCQAYISTEQFLSQGGSLDAFQKVKRAVEATSGEVLQYQGKLIEATYFSCSGGRTEDAVAVWGTDVPYLQSVESPNEEHAIHYMDTISLPVEEFCRKLEISSDDPIENWIGLITYTQGGGVDRIEICGKTFTGTQVRSSLGLYSTSFVITAVGDRVIVTTKGFGHRVGMSQYGADAMAARGADYRQILLHYYQDTVLASLQG